MHRFCSRTRHVVLASAIIGTLAAPVAFAADSRSVDGGDRNPSNNASQGFTSETQIIGNIGQNQGGHASGTGGYTTRQSNKSDSGGGAIYGCRAKAGTESCVAANNLANGDAFRFQATEAAADVGQFRFGLDLNKTVAKPPFVTNGTGLVKNLNADRLDGASKDDFVAKGTLLFAQVAADGTVGASRGVQPNASARFTADGTNQVASLPFAADIGKCAVTASPASVPSNAGTNPPALVASIDSDKKTVHLTEVGAGTEAYAAHVQVVC
jgi:hypothetical protein